MSEDRKERKSESPQKSRRGFLATLGGAALGVFASVDAAAQIRLTRPRQKPRQIEIPRERLEQIRKVLKLRETGPQGGDETPIPQKEREPFNPDDVPDFGPLICMAAPGYDPSPPGADPYLYANRFFEQWADNKPDWFGADQLATMKTPHWSWLKTTPTPPEWCAVSTVWNKGREPAYGVFMRALCFAVAKVSPSEWREVCRADLGYVNVGDLTPGDFIEVRYPVSAVRDGMKALDDYLMDNDPNCNQWPTLWYFHKCFAFDPIQDPLLLSAPIIAPDPPKSVIGGRHGGGWRWQAADQTPGQPRTRHFG